MGRQRFIKKTQKRLTIKNSKLEYILKINFFFIKIHHYETEEERQRLEKGIAICVFNKGLIARKNEPKKEKKKQLLSNPFEIANNTIEKLSKKLGQALHKKDI